MGEERPKPELKDNERAILESLNPRLEWIARDADGALWLYEEKPIKVNDDWYCKSLFYMCFEMYDHLFQFISFEDEKPYNIKELLEE